MDMVDIKSKTVVGKIGKVDVKVGDVVSVPLQEALPLYAAGRIDILCVTKKPVKKTEKK